MEKTTEQIDGETAANEESSERSRRGLKTGLLLLATGTILATGAKIRGKMDPAGLRQRVLQGKRLLLKSKEEANTPRDMKEQEIDESTLEEQPENTSEASGE